ncbi:hypothetical protein COT44_03200 [Candidatus Shapirobacteria bacterium CG08_land_8_20_14_0_20_39_18]|uniref:Uncharacterized protein n=1 Tax=Candidatus Shapirobacteria bacterium CG08_land_8_20_14_0_20_39_18 TaxID=1974883 RepID=A0A2M6XCM3_9BACT|nr:MAG: hypothetical protein COT44_03200 [Candidatus Shapirobacteria bacterium CG08_land_8_20_14_0_20_39_18]PIY65067.1 MAG: hypothetical protein COY91_03310 [Candidatus Shapirobacteria bacterium CG_4_10_14_0_8_um_filter_39_15]
MELEDRNIFGPVTNILTEQQKLRNLTLQKEGSNGNLQKSSVFLPLFDFAYFFSLYEIAGRHIEQLKFVSTNNDPKSIEYAKKIYTIDNLEFSTLDGLDQQKFTRQFDLILFIEVLSILIKKMKPAFLMNL